MVSRSQKAHNADNGPLEYWNQTFQEQVSLFEESNRTMRKKFLLHRLIVVSSLPQQLTNRIELGAQYEELNLHLQRQHQGDSITGLLLIYPSCTLHVIESSSDVLLSLVQNLSEKQQQADCILGEAPRILLMAHDLPSRLFQQWSYKVLDMEARTLGANSESEENTTERLVCSVHSLLCKLGKHPEIAKKSLPGSVLDELPGLIVPQEDVLQLLARAEPLSPQQYLHMYYAPFYIHMDSGHVFGSRCPYTV